MATESTLQLIRTQCGLFVDYAGEPQHDDTIVVNHAGAYQLWRYDGQDAVDIQWCYTQHPTQWPAFADGWTMIATKPNAFAQWKY